MVNTMRIRSSAPIRLRTSNSRVAAVTLCTTASTVRTGGLVDQVSSESGAAVIVTGRDCIEAGQQYGRAAQAGGFTSYRGSCGTSAARRRSASANWRWSAACDRCAVESP